MTVDGEIKKRLKEDGLTIDDLSPEQLERVRGEMEERMNLEPDEIMIDGFFSSVDYMALIIKKRHAPKCKSVNNQKK